MLSSIDKGANRGKVLATQARGNFKSKHKQAKEETFHQKLRKGCMELKERAGGESILQTNHKTGPKPAAISDWTASNKALKLETGCGFSNSVF